MPKFILNLVGKPYQANCYDGHAFDCYSLIHYIYAHYNIVIPKHILPTRLRTQQRQINQDLKLWQPVDYQDRMFLDVLLFKTSRRLQTHVGLVIDHKFFIHAVDDASVVLGKFKSSPHLANLHKVYRWPSK